MNSNSDYGMQHSEILAWDENLLEVSAWGMAWEDMSTNIDDTSILFGFNEGSVDSCVTFSHGY